MMDNPGKRFLKDEGGFTLAEMLVAMTMMMVVTFALYSLFDASLKVYGFGTDKVEAVENARVAMEKMEREIRAAYPNGGTLLGTSGADHITFWNVRDDGSMESITYQKSGSTLQRVSDDGQQEPVAENVKDLAFSYCGSPTSCSLAPDANTRLVWISMTVWVKQGSSSGATQTLTTEVYLRNAT